MSPTSYRTAPPRGTEMIDRNARSDRFERPERFNVARVMTDRKDRWALLGGRRVGGWGIFEDEHLLAGFHHAQVAAGQFFDRREVCFQPPDFGPQPGVLVFRRDNRLIEQPRLLPLLQHLQDALVAHQRVNEQDAADEDDQVLHHPPAAPRNPSARSFVSVLFHGLIVGEYRVLIASTTRLYRNLIRSTSHSGIPEGMPYK